MSEYSDASEKEEANYKTTALKIDGAEEKITEVRGFDWRDRELVFGTVPRVTVDKRSRVDSSVTNVRKSWREFVDYIVKGGHYQTDVKDSFALLPCAAIVEQAAYNGKDYVCARYAKNAATSDLLIYEGETGQTLDEITAICEAQEYAALLYHTRSNGKAMHVASEETLLGFMKKSERWRGNEGIFVAQDMAQITELIADFFAIEKFYLRRLTDTMRDAQYVQNIAELDPTKKGAGYAVKHAPMERWRLIMPRADTLYLSGPGVLQNDAQAEYKDRYLGGAMLLGIGIDPSCSDAMRGQYVPNRPTGSDPANYRIVVIDGKPVGEMPRLSDLKKKAAADADPFQAAADELGQRSGSQRNGAQARFKTPGLAEALARDKEQTFRVLDWMRENCPDRVVKDMGNDKEQIESPVSHLHNDGAGFNPDAPGAFAQQGLEGWNMFDSHASGKRAFSTPDGKHDKALMLDAMFEIVGVTDAVDVFEQFAELEPSFADRDDGELSPLEQAMQEFNDEGFAVVNMGGDARVVHPPRRKDDPVTFGCTAGFKTIYDTKKIAIQNPNGTTSNVPVAAAWLKWEKRKTFYHVAMNPFGLNDTDQTPPDILNLFNGWSVTPAPGDCSLLLAHIRDVICDGNQQNFEWLISWCAQFVKFPHLKTGTVVVMQGAKGCGKTTLSLVLKGLVHPSNAILLDKPDQLVGRFNGHIAGVILVASEEAFFAADKKVDRALKNLISGEQLAIENKGVAIFMADNHAHIIMSTNDEWAVPATEDERRYFVLKVADTYAAGQKNPETTAYFDELYAESVPTRANKNPPGLAAFAQYLLDWQQPEWVNLRHPPTTDGLRDQIGYGLQSHAQWMRDILERDNGVTVRSLSGGECTMQLPATSSAECFAAEAAKAAKVASRAGSQYSAQQQQQQGLLSAFSDQGAFANLSIVVRDSIVADGVTFYNVCTIDDVFDHYLAYAKMKGERFPASRKTLGKMLAKLGFERKRTEVKGKKVSFYLTPSRDEVATAFESVYRVDLDDGEDDDE